MTETIGIDLGSSAIKGVLLGENGRILATATRPTELQCPAPGEVVFSSSRCYELICEVLKTLAAQATRLGAVAISGATGDTVLLDASGHPLLPTMHWMDARSSADPSVDPPQMTASQIHQVSGWPWSRTFPLAHLAWLKTHAADAYRQAARVGMNLTYQYFRLCGEWVVDPSTATTFYLQDQENQRWYPPYLNWLGLQEDQLPEILPSGHSVGTISSAVAGETGLPEGCQVVLGAFDHPSAARGTGVLDPGDLLLSLGTSWVGFCPIQNRDLALKQKMLVDPFLSGEQGPWGGMFSLTKAGEKLNQALLSVYPDCTSPADRYSLFEQDLRAADRSNAATQMIHDLVNSLHKMTSEFARQGIPAERIVLVGGPSPNPAIADIIHEVFGQPVEVAPSSAHAGAAGAARLAAHSL